MQRQDDNGSMPATVQVILANNEQENERSLESEDKMLDLDCILDQESKNE